uniref:Uncharacterized protein n=1 Tax=Opuntia streptacantha TaxID=393608 RepID=A0A7C8ZXP8_OPUST
MRLKILFDTMSVPAVNVSMPLLQPVYELATSINDGQKKDLQQVEKAHQREAIGVSIYLCRSGHQKGEVSQVSPSVQFFKPGLFLCSLPGGLGVYACLLS